MSTRKETEEVMRRMEARRRAAEKKRRRTKRVLITIGVVLAVLLILVGMVYGIFRHYYDMMHHDNTETSPSILSTIAPDDDVDPTATNSDKNAINNAKDNIKNNQAADIVFHNQNMNHASPPSIRIPLPIAAKRKGRSRIILQMRPGVDPAPPKNQKRSSNRNDFSISANCCEFVTAVGFIRVLDFWMKKHYLNGVMKMQMN